MKKLRLINRNQKGFTLIELLIAIAIAAVVGASITVCIQQVMAKTVFSNNQLTTLNQVRNVGYWINHDVVMSQPGTEYVIANGTAVERNGRYELLQLKRSEWNETESKSLAICNYTYYFLKSPYEEEFQDLHREDYNVTAGITKDIVIAQYIDVNNTSCSYNSTSNLITLNVTAQYNNVVKSKTFQIGFRLTA
jgi:prepilin-type N-terminal cleavage/methylation domain-containing protein